MADLRISDLPALAQADAEATDDIPLNDVSAAETKRITAKGLVQKGVSSLIDDGSIPGAKVADDGITQAKIADDAVGADQLASNAVVTASVVDANITAPKLATNAVTTAKIADGSVTAAKLATGALTGASLSDGGVATAKIADDAVTNAKIATDAVNSDSIAANAVGTSEIAAGAVTTTELGADAVTNAKLADNAVETANITDANVTAAKLASSSVTTAKINDANVTGAKLATDAVTTAKIADGVVTYAKTNFTDGDIPGAKLTSGSVTSTELATGSVGTSEIAADAVTNAKIAPSAVGTTEIADNAITTNKLAADSVQTTDIQDGAVTRPKIADSAVNASKISDGSVINSKLADLSVSNSKIIGGTIGYEKTNFADGSIPGAKLTDSSVTASKLATDSVTQDKIADRAVGAVNIELNSITNTEIAANAIESTELAANSVITTKIADANVTTAKIADGNVTDAKLASGIDGTKLTDNTVTAAKVPSTSLDRGLDKVGGAIGHTNSVTAGTTSGITFDAQGHITGTAALTGSDLPEATTTALGGVSVPTTSGLSVTAAGELGIANTVTPATSAGITYNADGLITGSVALSGTDLPVATSTSVGGISIPATSGLEVDVAGNINIPASGVAAGLHTKVTVNDKGIITGGTVLTDADIPNISAAKITSGTIGTALIANDAVTGDKLADQSTVRFAGAPDTAGVVNFGTANYTGEFLYDEFHDDLYIWTGTSFKAIDIVSGEIVFAGTYDASTNLVASVTPKGTAIGLTVGQPLIAPAASNSNHYVTVSISGTGSGNAPAEALAPPDFLLSTGSSWQVLDLSAALAATTANNVSFAATGNIGSTNVQAAIEELDTEKVAGTNPNFSGTATFSGDVVLGTASTLTFEGSSADEYETRFLFVNPTADRELTFPDISGTLVTSGDTGTVTNAMLAGSIALTKLANLTAGQMIVANSSNVPTAVTLSGDATLANTGALTIANAAITSAKMSTTGVSAASYTNASITVDAQGRITAASSGSAGNPGTVTSVNVTGGTGLTASGGPVTSSGSITVDLDNTAVNAGSYTAADITVDAQGRITSAVSGTIGTSEIADDAVTAAKLADTAVTAGTYTLAEITVDAQGRITGAQSGTAADTDKIVEGNSEAEVVDTGSNGHFKVTTEGSERLRVGPAGQVGIAGANYGTSGQVLTSGGASGAIAWADAATGATGGGSDQWAIEHDNTITTSYTISSNKNVISAGPLTVNAAATVTVPSGSFWVIS